ncbi:MAG: hypothetical protein GXP49_06520 [Deltaproteobacteria bacterium]|nr:hypothetical protein [Deltaproteobacteria bacterium]
MSKTRQRNYDLFIEDILSSENIDDCSFQLESFLHQLFHGKTAIDKDHLEIMRSCLFDSIRRYGDQKRKLGGYYANHPLEVATVLAREGANPATVAAGLYHDVLEEGVARLRKELIRHEEAKYRALYGSAASFDNLATARSHGQKSFLRRETKIIQSYIEIIQSDLKSLMLGRGVPAKIADVSIRNILSAVLLVTRTHNQTYYEAMSNITGTGMLHRMKHGQEGIDRALAVKFADRLTNSLDLSRDYKIRKTHTDYGKVARITEASLRHAYFPADPERQRLLEGDLIMNRNHHPARGERGYRGSEKLYQFYKNIVLIHISRTRMLRRRLSTVKSPDLSMVYRKGGLEERLLNVNLSELNDILEHLLTFHLRSKVAARILEEFDEYDESGGLREATKAGGPSKFDGIIERFFDTRLTGNKKALQDLYRNKQGMFRAALGFKRVSELFKEDSEFRFEGIGPRGLKPQDRNKK